MKIKEGIYENLIIKAVQRDIERAEERRLICKQEEIDDAELPSFLVEHIKRIAYNKLSDDKLSREKRLSLANRLIQQLEASDDDDDDDDDDNDDNDNDDLIIGQGKMLSAVVSEQVEARLKATEQELVRPLTGFRVSSLFTGGQSKVSLNTELERDIESADRICLIVSFLKLSGLNLIFQKLKKFCEDPHHKLRIITTTYCGATDAKAIERLSELPNTEIRISYNTQIERLHAKSYIFERESGFSTAYIGSSNLSKSAQTDGLEWNIRVTNIENPHIIKTALSTFEQYWDSPNFEVFNGTTEDRNRLYAELKKERGPKNMEKLASLSKYTVLPHQKQILDKLIAVRAKGTKRNLIVAATGTGKTVISAFDYKLFRDENKPAPSKLLFIAHRKEILSQARDTYQSVLQDANFGELWVGDQKPAHSIDHLFVSIQTFNSHYLEIFEKLPTNYYDYIVIDEAHHITADSYRKVIGHFTPRLLIGLTATPERMDGVSLLPDFNGQISAEIRLPKALDEGLLTTFQYLCITDNTDLTGDELMQGNKYIATKLADRVCNDERVSMIVERLNYYLPDEHGCKALCFCATKEHASFMAEQFDRRGFKSAYLTGETKTLDREALNQKLSRGEINYLFVVDIFNEGVDIPEIDTVLFLRPTESITIFLQQLGRGLRLYPGKQQLTVFDFVAQLNSKYDYSSRFRHLMINTDKDLTRQIKHGFTALPHGCTIQMEEKAQQYVLDNIKAAIYNKKRLISELKSYTDCPTIKEFIDNNGQDIRILYRNGSCWTKLKRDAGLCDYTKDTTTEHYEKAMSKLLHTNSYEYLYFIKDTLSNLDNFRADGEQKIFALMFYYALYQAPINKMGFDSIDEAIINLRKYPLFIQELQELTEYLLDKIEIKTFAVDPVLYPKLEQYGRYTREEVFIIFGRQTEQKTMHGSLTGVFKIDEKDTELFFVTLNKSDKDFSPSTMYDDYIISEHRFHWKSQNTDSHEGRGKRFVEQARNNKKFLLFVREHKQDGFGNTCPFYCFGLVDYISSRDDRPMSIDWSMHHPILPQFLPIV